MGNFCPAYRQREGGQSAPPVSVVSQLPPAQNQYAKGAYFGVARPNPLQPLGDFTVTCPLSGGQFMASTNWNIANCQDGGHQLSKPVIPENASRSPSGFAKPLIILSHWDPRHRAP